MATRTKAKTVQSADTVITEEEIITGKGRGKGKKKEEIVDPLTIISKAAIPKSIKTDEDIDAEYNHIEAEQMDSVIKDNPIKGVANSKGNKLKKAIVDEDFQSELDVPIPVPSLRKVVIRKIPQFNFRMGLEKQPENPLLMPGVGHIWVCDKRGNEYLTGFDTRPEERARLEKILRVDLGPTSAFWSTLSFRLEDKQHGQILNFDDPQFGPMSEVIYFGMLGSSLMANGLQEYSTGKKPTATWYIEDKEAEAEMEQADMTSEQEAYAAFGEASFAKRRGAAKLLGLMAWGSTDKVISGDLWKFIKTNAENAKAFLKLIRKHETEFNVRVLASDAIKLNIIRKNRTQEYFIGDVVLGPTLDVIAQRLSLPQLNDVRLTLQNLVSAKQ